MFQFTPARGGRPVLLSISAMRASFQFTPARGGRPAPPTRILTWKRFNSRPRVAGDSVQREKLVAALFQFTPARGGRPSGCRTGRTPGGFNSRPRVAGDAEFVQIPMWHFEFQFTPARGGRLIPHRLSE